MTKRAEVRDLPEVLDVCKKVYAALGENGLRLFTGQKINWRAMQQYLENGITHPNEFAVWFSEYSILVANITFVWYNPTYRVCSEMLWMSSKPDQGGNLVRRLIEWAEDNRATHILLTDQLQDERVATFMTTLGFDEFGKEWSKDLI